jgi:hypothetical protein
MIGPTSKNLAVYGYLPIATTKTKNKEIMMQLFSRREWLVS